MEKDFVIYTDGGARGNPGPSGAGWVILDAEGVVLKKNLKFLGTQTNNFAEYEAVIQALTELKRYVSKEKRKEAHIEVRLDSELVQKQLSGEYKIKEETLFPQFIKVHNLRVGEFPRVIFTHIPRKLNNQADGLANDAMDSGQTSL